MKKLNLITLSLLSLPVFATNFVMVIDKEINDYEVGGFTDSKDDPAWIITSTSCSVDKEAVDIYYDQPYNQTQTCIEDSERTVTTTRTYENGTTEIISTSLETEQETIVTNNSITGTHLEDSCKNALSFDSSLGDGVYVINNGSKNYNVYCDMTTHGGGWTMATAQFEADPSYNWNEGIQSDYDPSLSTLKSFSLNISELPAHSEISFSQTDYDNMNTSSNYFNFVYTPLNIGLQTITEKTTGESFYIHRSDNSNYGWHDPDDYVIATGGIGAVWSNTLTIVGIDIGVKSFDFTYSINQSIQNYRGYAYAGNYLPHYAELGAYIIWVR